MIYRLFKKKKKVKVTWCAQNDVLRWLMRYSFFLEVVSRIRTFRDRWNRLTGGGYVKMYNCVERYDIYIINWHEKLISKWFFRPGHVVSRRLASLRVQRYRCMVPSRILLRPKILSLRLFLSSCPATDNPSSCVPAVHRDIPHHGFPLSKRDGQPWVPGRPVRDVATNASATTHVFFIINCNRFNSAKRIDVRGNLWRFGNFV